jgi:hypothetical protein
MGRSWIVNKKEIDKWMRFGSPAKRMMRATEPPRTGRNKYVGNWEQGSSTKVAGPVREW